MLDGIVQEVFRHQAHIPLVGHYDSLRSLHAQLHTLGNLAPAFTETRLHGLCQAHFHYVERFVVAFYLRELKQLIDVVQQLLAVAVDETQQLVTVFLRHCGIILCIEHFRETDDGIQRSTQGMTDIAQEHRLQFLAALGTMHLALQLLLVAFLEEDKHHHVDQDEH